MKRSFMGLKSLRSDSGLSEDGSHRLCGKCNEMLPLNHDYFSKDCTTRTGFRSICKSCVSLYRAKSEPKYDCDVERVCTKCKESLPLTEQNFGASNRGKYGVKAICRRCDGLYHKVRYAVDQSYRLAKRVSVDRRRLSCGRVSVDDVNILFCLQGGLCSYCQCDISNGYHIEHFHPVGKGGNNDFENLSLSCASCNLRKGKMTFSKFFSRLFSLETNSLKGAA